MTRHLDLSIIGSINEALCCCRATRDVIRNLKHTQWRNAEGPFLYFTSDLWRVTIPQLALLLTLSTRHTLQTQIMLQQGVVAFSEFTMPVLSVHFEHFCKYEK